MTRDLLTIAEAAQAKGVHLKSMYRAVQEGRVRSVRQGGRVWVSRAALAEWSAVPGEPRREARERG